VAPSFPLKLVTFYSAANTYTAKIVVEAAAGHTDQAFTPYLHLDLADLDEGRSQCEELLGTVHKTSGKESFWKHEIDLQLFQGTSCGSA
jgi:hypothetical protein